MLRIELDGLTRPAHIGEPVSGIPVLPLTIFRGRFGLPNLVACLERLRHELARFLGTARSGGLNRVGQLQQQAIALPVDGDHRQHMGAIERQAFCRDQCLGLARLLPHRIPSTLRLAALLDLGVHRAAEPLSRGDRPAARKRRVDTPQRYPGRRLARNRIQPRVEQGRRHHAARFGVIELVPILPRCSCRRRPRGRFEVLFVHGGHVRGRIGAELVCRPAPIKPGGAAGAA